MKKILIMCLALTGVMAFAGCARGYDSRTGINYRNGYNRYNTYDGYEDTYDTDYNGTMYDNGANYNGINNTPVR